MKNKRILSMFLTFAIFGSHLTHNLNAIHNSENEEQTKSLEKIFENDLENSDDEEETEISENNPENLNDDSNILNQNLNSKPKTDNILSKFYNLILKHKIKSGVALLSIVPILYHFKNKQDNPNENSNKTKPQTGKNTNSNIGQKSKSQKKEDNHSDNKQDNPNENSNKTKSQTGKNTNSNIGQKSKSQKKIDNNSLINDLKHIYGDIPFNAIVPILEWKHNNCSFNATLYAMYSPEKKDLYEKISKMNPEEVIDFVQKECPDLFKFKNEYDYGNSWWNDEPVISKGGPKGTDFEFKARKEFSAQMLIRLCKILNQMEEFAIKNPNKAFPYFKGVGNDCRKRVLEETLTFGTQTSKQRSDGEHKDLNENCYLFRMPGNFTSPDNIIDNVQSLGLIWNSEFVLCTVKRESYPHINLIFEGYKKIRNENFDRIEDLVNFMIGNKFDKLPVAFAFSNNSYTYSVQIKYKYDKNNNLAFSKFLFLNCHGRKHELYDSSDKFNCKFSIYYDSSCWVQSATREEIENNKYYYMYDPNDPWKYISEYLQNRRS